MDYKNFTKDITYLKKKNTHKTKKGSSIRQVKIKIGKKNKIKLATLYFKIKRWQMRYLKRWEYNGYEYSNFKVSFETSESKKK